MKASRKQIFRLFLEDWEKLSDLKIRLVISFISRHGEQIAEARLCLQGQATNNNLLAVSEPLEFFIIAQCSRDVCRERKNINKYLHTLTKTVPSVSTVEHADIILKRKA